MAVKKFYAGSGSITLATNFKNTTKYSLIFKNHYFLCGNDVYAVTYLKIFFRNGKYFYRDAWWKDEKLLYDDTFQFINFQYKKDEDENTRLL